MRTWLDLRFLVAEVTEYREEDNATTQTLLILDVPPLFGGDVSGDEDITRVKFHRATMYRNLVRAAVDELVELGGLHTVALELVQDDDVSLRVAVPVETGSFGTRDSVNAVAEVAGEFQGESGLAGASGTVEYKTNGFEVIGTRLSDEVLHLANTRGVTDHLDGVRQSDVSEGSASAEGASNFPQGGILALMFRLSPGPRTLEASIDLISVVDSLLLRPAAGLEVGGGIVEALVGMQCRVRYLGVELSVPLPMQAIAFGGNLKLPRGVGAMRPEGGI